MKNLKHDKQLDFFISKYQLRQIDVRFRAFIGNSSVSVYSRLPKKEYYYNAFYACYAFFGVGKIRHNYLGNFVTRRQFFYSAIYIYIGKIKNSAIC